MNKNFVSSEDVINDLSTELLSEDRLTKEPRPFVNDYFCSDRINLVILFTWTFALNLLGLGAVEFFRHTEADRTLIGWEMATSGNYVVPHLLGSVILTKPPIYYWLVAASVSFFGSASEWVARFPSVIASVMYVCTHYVFLRKSKATPSFALLSALMLSSCVLFFRLSSVAEIDMVFGFLCAVALYAAYFACLETSFFSVLLASVALALAFLTKGPPIVFFVVVSSACFIVWSHLQSDKRESLLSFRRYIVWAVIAAGLFMVIAGSWVVLVASEVGWETLGQQLRVEVFERIVVSSKHPRGAFFYLGSLVSGLAPWSILLVAGMVLAIKQRRAYLPQVGERIGFSKEFFVFNLIVVVSALIMLTTAQGKSSRYLFPVYAFAINLSAYYSVALSCSGFEKVLFYIGRIVSALAVLLAMTAPFFVDLPGVNSLELWIAGLVLGGSFLLLGASCFGKQRKFIMLSLLVVMFSFRFAESTVFASHRNFERSVKSIALEVDDLMQPGEVLYTLEMFERWIVYYLASEGRKVKRLSPPVVESVSSKEGSVFIMITFAEEYWRLEQLQFYDREGVEIVKDFKRGREHVMLLKVDSNLLRYLEPLGYFPTVPSKPYYYEAKQLAGF